MSDRAFDSKRFSPTPESMQGYRIIRDFVRERAETDPRLIGITFVGSRIHGLEHDQSDFDSIVLYDGADFANPAAGSISDQAKKHEAKKQYIHDLQVGVETMMKQAGLPMDEVAHGKSFVIVDGSSANIRAFKYEVNRLFQGEPVVAEKLHDDFYSPGFALSALFFWGIGPKLTEKRNELLTALENDPDGEAVFHDLMEYVQHYERTAKTAKRPGLSPYKYPTTLAEGRKYFSIKK